MSITRSARVRLIRQTAQADCGHACLAMLLATFGTLPNFTELQEALPLTRRGVSAEQLKRAAQRFGLALCVIRLPPNSPALTDLLTPCILHWLDNHFVVLEGAAADIVYIADPASGRKIIDRGQLGKYWTGVAIVCPPEGRF